MRFPDLEEAFFKFYNGEPSKEDLNYLDYRSEMDSEDPPLYIYNPINSQDFINSEGNITETSSANVFYIKDEAIRTPPINDGLLPGVTRRLVIALASRLGKTVEEESIKPKQLEKADAIFVTSAATGIRNVERIEATKLPSNKLVNDLKNAYENELTKHAILAAKSTGT